jgi:hypothetical protein
MSSTKAPVVVIIGASYAGNGVARGLLNSLSKSIKVVLINPSDKFYFNIAAPRILTNPDAFRPDQYLLPIESAFSSFPRGSFEFIQGSVYAIDPEKQTVSVSGRQMPVSYDHLVIASGSSTAASRQQGTLAPTKATATGDLQADIETAQKTISKAQSVVIGGAGPVGVELAGEFADAWEKRRAATQVTLVSASHHVLSMLKTGAGVAAEKALTKKGVKLVTSRKIVSAKQPNGSGKWAITLDDGDTLEADIYISSTGVVPNSDFIPSEFLSTGGWVQVDDELRVTAGSQSKHGRRDQLIYAVGDITTHPVRMAMKVGEQVPVVVANLKADITGQGKRATYVQNPKIAMMLVPVGASTGTGVAMGWVVWSKLVSLMKGRDFFVSKAAGLGGLKQ